MGCPFHLQGIFSTQGSNSNLHWLLHWQVKSGSSAKWPACSSPGTCEVPGKPAEPCQTQMLRTSPVAWRCLANSVLMLRKLKIWDWDVRKVLSLRGHRWRPWGTKPSRKQGSLSDPRGYSWFLPLKLEEDSSSPSWDTQGYFSCFWLASRIKSQLTESVQDAEIHTRHLGGSGRYVKSSVSLLKPILPAPVQSPVFVGWMKWLHGLLFVAEF